MFRCNYILLETLFLKESLFTLSLGSYHPNHHQPHQKGKPATLWLQKWHITFSIDYLLQFLNNKSKKDPRHTFILFKPYI